MNHRFQGLRTLTGMYPLARFFFGGGGVPSSIPPLGGSTSAHYLHVSTLHTPSLMSPRPLVTLPWEEVMFPETVFLV
jgi:hypothetical protein